MPKRRKLSLSRESESCKKNRLSEEQERNKTRQARFREAHKRKLHLESIRDLNRVNNNKERHESRNNFFDGERDFLKTTNDWNDFENLAFKYNNKSNYDEYNLIQIGNMNVKCNFCAARRFKSESANICCNFGRVKLADYDLLPEPLNSLINGTHRRSKYFLNNIRMFNNAFNMTSFMSTGPNIQTNNMTFKIQGQVYHRIGPLLSDNIDTARCLQLYFLGNEEAQADVRAKLSSINGKELLILLNRMLEQTNIYIKTFRTTLEKNVNTDFKIIKSSFARSTSFGM